MRRVLSVVVILAFILATLTFLSPPAEAAWNPAGERGEARFELIPQEGRVHVTLNYHVQNLDPDTRFDRSYYTAWNVALLSDAQNIKVPSTITMLQSIGPWKWARVNYNVRLFYGVSYDFTVEYDLPGMTSSVANFLAYGDTYSATVKVLVPLGYSTELSQSGYLLEKTPTHQVYTYSLARDGSSFVTQVSAVGATSYQSISGTANLKGKTTSVTVYYWEGETSKAQNILSLYTRALPVLEDITAVPFPRSYSISVRESTSSDIKGFGGVNSGAGGIRIAATEMQDDGTLLHELAHYWATKPPFGEDWMHEGFAELYAYLALRNLGKDSESEAVKNYRFREYEKYKDRFILPLAQWNSEPPATSQDLDLLSFGYAKSFVFVLGLYDKLGLAALQKFNQEAFAASSPIDWVEFNRILARVTGQDQSALFAGWVVPGVAQPTGSSYDSWQKAQKAYQLAEQVISASKSALGISAVERALALARTSLVKGQYDDVSLQVDAALKLFARWKEAEKVYRQAETTIGQSRGALGIGSVQQKLDSVRSLLVAGQFEQVIPQTEAALKLYEAWQQAGQAYQQAEKVILGSKGGLGIGEVENSLALARASLVQGQYDRVSQQAQVALKLLSQWQEAEKAYRQAETTISSSRGALGIASVQQKLDSVRSLLVAGQFDQVIAQADATLKLYEAWQWAGQAYQQAEKVISGSKGALGMAEVEKALELARSLLLLGQYDRVLQQTQVALRLFDRWQEAEKSYRQAETTISQSRGALGIDSVQQKLDSVRSLLVAGQFEQVASQAEASLKLYQAWQRADKAYSEAVTTIGQSRGSLGITMVERQLETVREALSKGQFDQVLARVQATLQLYAEWNKAQAAYSQVAEAVASSSGALGIEAVSNEVTLARDFLAGGPFEFSLLHSQSALKLYESWQVAAKARQEAAQAISLARQEGRTWHLSDAETALGQSDAFLISGHFEQATTSAQQAGERARQAITVWQAIAPVAVPIALLVIAIPAFILIRRRMSEVDPIIRTGC